MTKLKGHFDGTGIVFDEPIPVGIHRGDPVEVVFVREESESEGNCRSFVERIWPLMGSISGPGDLSEEHDHYAHGAPKRSDRDG